MLDTLLACEAFDFGSFNLSSLNIEDEVIPLVAMGGVFVVMVLGMIAGTVRKIALGRAREVSRREIAAYIAEGSMSAEEGERLLSAGRPHRERWHC